MVKFPNFSNIFSNRKVQVPIAYSLQREWIKEEEDRGKATIATKDKYLYGKEDNESPNDTLMYKYFNAYHNFPVVAAAIDSKAEQVVQDFRFEGPQSKQLLKWAERINLKHHLRRICKNGLIGGTYWAELIDVEDSVKKGLQRLNPVTFKHIDPRTMSIVRTTKGATICHLQDVSNNKIYWGDAPTSVGNAIKGGELDDMFCWKWNVIGSDKYGTSIIHSSLPTLATKDSLESDMKVILKRYLAPLIHATVGDELHYADETAVEGMKAQLEDIYSDTEYVTNHLVKMEVLDFKNKGVDAKPYFDHIDSQVLIGLQTHSVLLATDVGNNDTGEKSAEIRLRANGRHIKAIQDELKIAIDEQVLYKITGNRDNKIVWESVEERQFELDVNILTTMVKNGILTQQKANDMLPDQYREKLPEAMPFATDQKVPYDESVKDNPNDPTKSTNTEDGNRVDKDEVLSIKPAKKNPQDVTKEKMI